MTRAERYSVHYRISGPLLDVDALLTRARPAGPCDVWRRGDPIDDGHRAHTSGVQIDIVDHDDAAEVVEAVDAFLDAESQFLAAVAARGDGESYSVLAIALWVYADEPSELALPAETLQRLAQAGIGLEVSGYPHDSSSYE